MKHTPCEQMIWHGLPLIRKELAESLINDFGLSQRKTAEKLGLTPAAVCQYKSKKRSCTTITDEIILKEITVSAERILKEDQTIVVSEICRICQILRSHNMTFLSINLDEEENQSE